MIAKYWIQCDSVSKIVVRHRLKHCTIKTFCRIKSGNLQYHFCSHRCKLNFHVNRREERPKTNLELTWVTRQYWLYKFCTTVLAKMKEPLWELRIFANGKDENVMQYRKMLKWETRSRFQVCCGFVWNYFVTFLSQRELIPGLITVRVTTDSLHENFLQFFCSAHGMCYSLGLISRFVSFLEQMFHFETYFGLEQF